MSTTRHILAVLVLSVIGCSQAEPPPGAPPPPPAPAEEKALVVFAATSLRDVFSRLGQDFERAHPGVAITFNFAGTQELRTQLEHGAAVDVFASADARHMDELRKAGRVTRSVVFTRNEPVIVVAREAAATIHGLADLPAAERIVIGAPQVPIGRYTLQILDRAAASLGPDFRTRVEARVVSRELNVRQVLAKVSLGEAQAGVVYRTDVKPDPALTSVPIPPELNVIAEYPIAVVEAAPHPELARAWIALVLSADGQRALEGAGFVPDATTQ